MLKTSWKYERIFCRKYASFPSPISSRFATRWIFWYDCKGAL
jgi:hypothetical protein